MSDPRSAPELLVLQAIRLGGVSDLDAVLDRVLVRNDAVEEVIAQSASAGWVERMTFADLSGWVLTSSGADHLTGLLGKDVAAADAAAALRTTVTRFEDTNARFVERVSAWQLRSSDNLPPESENPEFADLLADLDTLGEELRTLLADLIGVMPRFGRYPAQYERAVAKARSEGLRWVTGVGLLSCHTVWAELHQDLLSSAGLRRTPDSSDGGDDDHSQLNPRSTDRHPGSP